MSFTNAPVTRALVYGSIGTSIAASLLDIKHYFYILVDLHIWRFHQTWRALIYQLCYTNSAEVLFAVLTLYNLRSIERLWGSRKYATFIFITFLLTSIISPLLLAVVIRPLSLGLVNYLPAGPTPIIFAVLAQYHAIIPHLFKFRIATSITQSPNDQFQGITFSDKSYKYLLALQLALFQWPGSILGALVGWVVGYAWRMEVLPRSLMRWRIPGWVVEVRNSKGFDEGSKMKAHQQLQQQGWRDSREANAGERSFEEHSENKQGNARFNTTIKPCSSVYAFVVFNNCVDRVDAMIRGIYAANFQLGYPDTVEEVLLDCPKPPNEAAKFISSVQCKGVEVESGNKFMTTLHVVGLAEALLQQPKLKIEKQGCTLAGSASDRMLSAQS